MSRGGGKVLHLVLYGALPSADPPTRGRWVPAVRLLSVTTVENNACRSFVDDVN